MRARAIAIDAFRGPAQVARRSHFLASCHCNVFCCALSSPPPVRSDVARIHSKVRATPPRLITAHNRRRRRRPERLPPRALHNRRAPPRSIHRRPRRRPVLRSITHPRARRRTRRPPAAVAAGQARAQAVAAGARLPPTPAYPHPEPTLACRHATPVAPGPIRAGHRPTRASSVVFVSGRHVRSRRARPATSSPRPLSNH